MHMRQTQNQQVVFPPPQMFLILLLASHFYFSSGGPCTVFAILLLLGWPNVSGWAHVLLALSGLLYLTLAATSIGPRSSRRSSGG